MQFYNKVKKIKKKFKIKRFKLVLLKNFNKFYKKQLVNSSISSILRLIFRSKSLFEIYFILKKSRSDFKSVNQFWIIRIGFINKIKNLPFVSFDFSLLNNPFCCINLRFLPYESESCQIIYIKHFFRYFSNRNFKKVIKSWEKKLIPGGILKIQFKLVGNEKNFKILKKTLSKNNFYIKNIDNFDLEVNGHVTVISIKQKIISSASIPIPLEKYNDIYTILEQNKELFSNKEKICILGRQSKKICNYLKEKDLNIDQIDSIEKNYSLLDISDNYFDSAIIVNYFEYFNYSSNHDIFNFLKRKLKANANILAIVPEKKSYSLKQTTQYFDKGIFTRILDENNVKIEWINLSTSFKMIQAFIKNSSNYPLNKNKSKIILLGNYSLRYTFLNNARWDSQARAFEKLGYNIQIIDFTENSFIYIFKRIKMFNPDILWIGAKAGYDFLRRYPKFFRNSKIKVVYWLWDIITPVEFDFKNVIDFMFITSKGEIPMYKKAYNLERVYYMPVGIMPEIIHRNKFIKEKYDIGFSGQLSNYNPFYKERTEMLNFVRLHFRVKIFKNLYNNLPEYYSLCKIIFGGTPYFKDLELYASNRPYVALSCGCCFVTNYFKGLEKLAENEKHLIWYNSKDELKSLLQKYISNKTLREQIKNNAEVLANEKHNYMVRITNMLDIINEKTEDFYGFIK